MSGEGIAQIVLYLVVLVALSYPLGKWMAYVYSDRFRAPRWVAAPERGFYRLMGTDPTQEQDWKGYAKVAIVFMVVFSVLLYLLLRLQEHLPLNPDSLPARVAAHRDEHDRQLHHEHELAVLRRRVHHVVPVADGGARRAELRLGGHRHGRPRRRDPRLLAPLDHHARQLLGRPLPVDRLHPAAARRRPRGDPDVAGRAADLQRRRRRAHARGRDADDRARPGRVADRDQAARDERRRLLQLELRRPVREPERTSRTSSRCCRSC